MVKSVWIAVQVTVDNTIAEDTIRDVIDDAIEIGMDSMNNSEPPHENQNIINKVVRISTEDMNQC